MISRELSISSRLWPTITEPYCVSEAQTPLRGDVAVMGHIPAELSKPGGANPPLCRLAR